MRIGARVPIIPRETVREVALVFVYLDGYKTSVSRDDIQRTRYGYHLYLYGQRWISADGIYYRKDNI